jgi:Flp pilus assembly protein TadB
VTVVCVLLAVVAGAMAFVQSTMRDVAKKRDTEIAKATAAHFRFTGFAYGATAVLAIIAAITSSSLAFALAIVSLVSVTVSRMAFGSRRRSIARRRRAADCSELE